MDCCINCEQIDTLVEVQSKGYIRCSKCGVVQERTLDFRPILDVNNPDHYTLYDLSDVHPDIIRGAESLDIPDNTTELAGYLFQNMPSTKADNRMATMARCLYQACLQTNIIRPRELFWDIYGVTESQFTHTHNKTLIDHSTVQVQSIRSRFAANAQALLADEKKRLGILEQCSKIESTLKSDNHFINTKPSKMDGVLFYYVAGLQNCKIDKKHVLTLCNISNVTFNKHLNYIKARLDRP